MLICLYYNVGIYYNSIRAEIAFLLFWFDYMNAVWIVVRDS